MVFDHIIGPFWITLSQSKLNLTKNDLYLIANTFHQELNTIKAEQVPEKPQGKVVDLHAKKEEKEAVVLEDSEAAA